MNILIASFSYSSLMTGILTACECDELTNSNEINVYIFSQHFRKIKRHNQIIKSLRSLFPSKFNIIELRTDSITPRYMDKVYAPRYYDFSTLMKFLKCQNILKNTNLIEFGDSYGLFNNNLNLLPNDIKDAAKVLTRRLRDRMLYGNINYERKFILPLNISTKQTIYQQLSIENSKKSLCKFVQNLAIPFGEYDFDYSIILLSNFSFTGHCEYNLEFREILAVIKSELEKFPNVVLKPHPRSEFALLSELKSYNSKRIHLHNESSFPVEFYQFRHRGQRIVCLGTTAYMPLNYLREGLDVKQGYSEDAMIRLVGRNSRGPWRWEKSMREFSHV